MVEFYNRPKPKTSSEVLDLYGAALAYRNLNPGESQAIALFVFDASHGVTMGPDMTKLRYEFGALEAPGMPADSTMDPYVYENYLWSRLEEMFDKLKHQYASG